MSVSLHCNFDKNLSIVQIHDLTSRIEERLKEKIPGLDRCVVPRRAGFFLMRIAVRTFLSSASRCSRPIRRRPIQTAVRVEQGPRLDGRLDDEVWRLAPAFTGFGWSFPSMGSYRKDRAPLLYDDSAYISVSAVLTVHPRKSAANTMGQRPGRGSPGR